MELHIFPLGAPRAWEDGPCIILPPKGGLGAFPNPASIVSGKLGEVTEKWGELEVALAIVREAFPLLLAVTV